MAHAFTTKTGAKVNPLFSAMIGHSAQTHLKTKCFTYVPKVTDASHMTAEDTDAQANPGTETT